MDGGWIGAWSGLTKVTGMEVISVKLGRRQSWRMKKDTRCSANPAYWVIAYAFAPSSIVSRLGFLFRQYGGCRPLRRKIGT